ncbi:PhaM family polyhydroxyalkanoate granule multifunctional regulatory protein [Paraburkholderia dinghuensis]|uniref:Transcriptional regulator n=1 Tax=Paraburkholderia dinghuensis TaxID=2305225 RepID=A0A3N6MLL4_9BURK|nr:PhaM family polyhydroxyalkanoate granule multifunctional regulatory protein [Paraburkholderia dinghuensis]RQH04694.1 transcriptional regulator [Paraburkholderia dinghuensis]
MTDSAGSVPPFPGFPGFPPAEMLDRMWGMMRLTPFGSAFPGSEPGMAQGFGPSLSMMSDMMTPLTNIEELDKRITDLRAVEQWLKLNLSMLQSSIQALEVQRATLSTLRAFGAFAQSQMSPPPASSSASSSRSAHAAPEPEPAPEASASDSAPPPGFDTSAWWNLLQAQFNQLAQFAAAQPVPATKEGDAAAAQNADAKPAARRSGGTTKSSASRAAKKAPAKPE